MHTLPLSEFRANASAMLDLVEQGETVRIMRHGKPVAHLVPATDDNAAAHVPSWKRPFEPVVLPAGQSLGDAIRQERGAAPW
ncbi:type II toxin-antitoxin system prevent-host-death family antitoxin [Xylophilus sp. Kf1]|nr:type II toxin-antitoxin system prevent-host-death family antitoxin [Xylophilus sp. Kf1]